MQKQNDKIEKELNKPEVKMMEKREKNSKEKKMLQDIYDKSAFKYLESLKSPMRIARRRAATKCGRWT